MIDLLMKIFYKDFCLCKFFWATPDIRSCEPNQQTKPNQILSNQKA